MIAQKNTLNIRCLLDSMLDKPQKQWYYNYIRFMFALFSFIPSKALRSSLKPRFFFLTAPKAVTT